MANFNNQAKRKRELAKKDKRAAKDQNRAQRKAAARGASAPAAVSHAAPIVSKPSISKAAAEWMKPLSKKAAIKTGPRTVAAAAFIRRLNIGS